VPIKPEYEVGDVEAARAVVRAHPFATVITAELRVTRMPFLLDEAADGLTVEGHVAKQDPAAHDLARPLLVMFTGPHGYVSASWYGEDMIPTWNHVTLLLRGRPEPFDDALPLLRRTVDHFESAVERPWSLDRMGQTAREMADKVIAFRIPAESWHLEAKLSQDKPADERRRVIAGLDHAGPYVNPPLARAVRAFNP
jgi:transcriptional regulator